MDSLEEEIPWSKEQLLRAIKYLNFRFKLDIRNSYLPEDLIDINDYIEENYERLYEPQQ